MAKKVWSKMLAEWKQLVRKAKDQLGKLKANENTRGKAPQV